jgi:hypothetical protein
MENLKKQIQDEIQTCNEVIEMLIEKELLLKEQNKGKKREQDNRKIIWINRLLCFEQVLNMIENEQATPDAKS